MHDKVDFLVEQLGFKLVGPEALAEGGQRGRLVLVAESGEGVHLEVDVGVVRLEGGNDEVDLSEGEGRAAGADVDCLFLFGHGGGSVVASGEFGVMMIWWLRVRVRGE